MRPRPHTAASEATGPAADRDVPVLDVLGVGFGPSNLALAIAAVEHNAAAAQGSLSVRFVERQAGFGWHRGMLLDDATMQVSFLKDLVTLRNPTSPFSFLAYLYDQGRLVDFVNHKSLFPLRVEFHDYLEWAATRVAELVRWDTEVVDVVPVETGGMIDCLDVVTAPRSGAAACAPIRTRNLVIGTGLRPRLPDGVIASERIFHSSDLLDRVDRFDPAEVARVVVVGAGQSAAEVTAYLHRRFAGAEVCVVFSRYGYSPADDSPFANRIFDPAAVDEFYGSPPDVKRMLLAYHGNTNYSVVDGELIEQLYRQAYQEQVTGARRLRLFNVSRLLDVTETGTGVRAVVTSLATAERTVLDADLVVYSTGYHSVDPYPLLGAAGVYCHRDGRGRPQVERDYRICTSADLRCGIYLQGGTEHTHGLSSSLLSNAAIRAGEILRSVLAHRDHARTAARPEHLAASAHGR